jgi:hypothetical protein
MIAFVSLPTPQVTRRHFGQFNPMNRSQIWQFTIAHLTLGKFLPANFVAVTFLVQPLLPYEYEKAPLNLGLTGPIIA